MKLLYILAAAGVAFLPSSALANRMGGYDYNIPSRPTRPVAPPQQTQPVYGVFRVYGPLPEGRVRVHADNSFETGQIAGYRVQVQDNGRTANDQMIIHGPEGVDEVWLNCNVTQDWKAYGPNSKQFVHNIVSRYCNWN